MAPLQPTRSPSKAPHTSQEPSPSWEVPECPHRARIGTPNRHKAQQLGAACPRSRCSCPAAQVTGHQLRKRHQSLGFHRNKKKKTFPEKAARIEREIERREHAAAPLGVQMCCQWAALCPLKAPFSPDLAGPKRPLVGELAATFTSGFKEQSPWPVLTPSPSRFGLLFPGGHQTEGT